MTMTRIGFLLPFVLAAIVTNTRAQDIHSPELKATIQLPGVRGRIDHMAIDVRTNLVYVCALGNNTVEVAHLGSSKWLRSLSGFSEPQGVLLDKEHNRLFVTNGGRGTCSILDATSLMVVQTISGLPDADNIRFDKASNLVFVGFGSGGLAAIDPLPPRPTFTVQLPAHPESFQLETEGYGVYVNVPTAGKIFVIDRKTKRVTTSWPVQGASENFPMALNEERGLLYAGFRDPACIQIIHVRSGEVSQSVPIGEDVDDVFYDAKRERVYASCGGGEMDILASDTSGALKLAGRVPTRKGARTSLLVPELDIVIVAAPARDDKQAELLIYSLGR